MSNSTPRAALPEPAAVYMRGCNIDIPEGTYLYTAEQVVLACAAVCRARVVGDHNREDAEAKRCEEAILALLPMLPGRPARGAVRIRKGGLR